MQWRYEKLDENYEIKTCPRDDKDGSVTGKIILNVPAYFDENPEEQKRLGWVKHIYFDDKEIKEKWPHTMSQYLVQTTKKIDDWTIEDEYHILDKSEEMMLLEELLQGIWGDNGFVFM